jgi:superfamily II DNA or RNA helicase
MAREMLRLRPYQNKALDTYRGHVDHVQRQALVIPTGGGKTVVFAYMADEWVQQEHKRHRLPHRVLILAHRDELVNQAVDKLKQVAPKLNIGIIKAGQNDTDADIIVASVQTLAREGRRAQLPPIGLVIIDECHHATGSSYRAVMEHVGCFYDGPYANLKAKAVGVTATLTRASGGARGVDLGDVWQEVTFRLDILDLIEGGFLVDVKGRRVTVDGLKFEDVAVERGDYAAGSLSEALMSSDARRVTVDAYEKYASDRSGVVFLPNVESAQAFAEEFRDRGFKAEAVWGSMPVDERRRILAGVDSGEIQVVTNCAVLTEGWDSPRVSCAVIARPTLSAGLYVQMVGRVLRPFPGKKDALVLDVAGASENHQLATLADLTSRRLEEVPEGESLTRAVMLERIDGNPYLQNYVLDSYEVDLFRRAEALWLQTKAGVWFTTAGSGREDARLFFLWPGSEPGTYKAGWRPTHKKGGGWLTEDVPFSVAQDWAEQEALSYDAANPTGQGASLARRNASWRAGREPVTSGQLTRARTLGLDVSEGMLKRDVSDMISVQLASRALDKPLTRTA